MFLGSMINTEAASSLGNRTPNVSGTCTIHCRFYCLCFELLMPEPSPLKRLGFFMSKTKLNIEDRNRCKASAYAVHVLKGKGVRFDKTVPKQKDVVREMKTSGLVESDMLTKGEKEVLIWYYNNNVSAIKARKSLINNYVAERKVAKAQTVKAIPVPTGYESRCRQDEPLDLTPDVFYKSWRWKELRLIALNVCGRRCVCCGATPTPSNKVVLHVDHIKPLRSNPSLALDLSNLQVLCEDCNQGKSWFNTNDYRTDSQKNSMYRKQTESFAVTEDAISRMHR